MTGRAILRRVTDAATEGVLVVALIVLAPALNEAHRREQLRWEGR